MMFRFLDTIVLMRLKKMSLFRDSAQKLQPCTHNVPRLSKGCNKVATISARVQLKIEFAPQTRRCTELTPLSSHFRWGAQFVRCRNSHCSNLLQATSSRVGVARKLPIFKSALNRLNTKVILCTSGNEQHGVLLIMQLVQAGYLPPNQRYV